MVPSTVENDVADEKKDGDTDNDLGLNTTVAQVRSRRQSCSVAGRRETWEKRRLRRDSFIMDGRSRNDHRPSPPYNAGTEHVGFSPTRQALLAPTKREAP